MCRIKGCDAWTGLTAFSDILFADYFLLLMKFFMSLDLGTNGHLQSAYIPPWYPL